MRLTTRVYGIQHNSAAEAFLKVRLFNFPSRFLPYNSSIIRMNINKKRKISRLHHQPPHLWRASDSPVTEDAIHSAVNYAFHARHEVTSVRVPLPPKPRRPLSPIMVAFSPPHVEFFLCTCIMPLKKFMCALPCTTPSSWWCHTKMDYHGSVVMLGTVNDWSSCVFG